MDAAYKDVWLYNKEFNTYQEQSSFRCPENTEDLVHLG